MTVTVTYLSGVFERFDETLRKYIFDNWTGSGGAPEGITPKMISPHGEDGGAADLTKVKSANAWMLHINKDLIRFKQLDSRRQEKEGDGASVLRKNAIVSIDVFGETVHRAWLFANHVEDIVLNNLPNQSLRINKSDGAASAIAIFDRLSIDWVEVPKFEDLGIRYQLAGELGCIFQKQKT